MQPFSSQHSIIILTGLCTEPGGNVCSTIVLAGDPMQLDPVTKFKHAKDLGFNVSFMNQLFKQQLYKRNKVTKEFNPKFITQLVKNYRSHKDILKVPNEMFYENRLEPQATGLLKNLISSSTFF